MAYIRKINSILRKCECKILESAMYNVGITFINTLTLIIVRTKDKKEKE